MTFLVTLIALLIERFFDWSHLRRWDWFTSWEKWVLSKFNHQSIALKLTAILLPIGAVTLFLQFVLRGVAFGLFEFLFQLIIFLYCLGPQNLWADTFACLNALVHGDANLAMEKLKTAFGLTEAVSSEPIPGQLLNQVFIAANQRIFAIIFWFLILGPVGAVLYRSLTLTSATFPQQEAVPQLVDTASKIQTYLDWMPAQLLTCLFALGGHFANVMACWRQSSVFNCDDNNKLLVECGVAALGGQEINRFAENGATVRNAIGLLDRAFVISLIFVILFVLLV